VDTRSTLFLDVMMVIAVLGALAFLARLILDRTRYSEIAGMSTRAALGSVQWYGFIPALVLLTVAAALAVWLILTGDQGVWGERLGTWQSDPRAMAFTGVMIGLATAGLIGTVIYVAFAATRRSGPGLALASSPPAAAATAVTTPSAWRLLGLMMLVMGLLLMSWIALSRSTQQALMQTLVYPASLGVGLVLLFDKASRTFTIKSGAENVREWLVCDTMVFLLIIGFLNLRTIEKPDTYAATFWDTLNIVLFFLAFWLVDRTASRVRFLVGYGYFTVLPILLLIWRAVQAVDQAGASSVWPFFILGLVFFCLELVMVLSSVGTERHLLAAVKDGVFVLLFAVLLVVSASPGPA
jgi:hypothetical protein